VSNPDYERQIQIWREQMDASLRADNGWLALAGLFWLHEGANTIGTHPSSEVVLPANSAPEQAGSFDVWKGRVVFHTQPGVPVTLKGEPVTTVTMQSNAAGTPTKLTLNALDWQVLQYGERFAVRLWDRNSSTRKEFTGRLWFPIDTAYRVSAQFVRHLVPRTLNIATLVDGITEPSPNPGYVTFQMRAQAVQMEAVARDDGGLRFIFHDLSGGATTHPHGRYLDAEPHHLRHKRGAGRPERGAGADGRVVLDFNRACNLPCAFTPFSICPLAPPQNYLRIAIEAGERFDARD
jgi:uncharacterized protein (DUF1684 family)